MSKKSNYRREAQQVREAYSVDLVEQVWLECGASFPTSRFVAELLHLLSDRFDVDRAKPNIHDQLGELSLSAVHEIRASMPFVVDQGVDKLLLELTNGTESFVERFEQREPTREDFELFSNELVAILIASRYIVVRNYVAKDQNRRRRNGQAKVNRVSERGDE